MIQLQKHTSTKRTNQIDPVIGKNQVRNSAGGYAFQLDDWKRLHRFLILGTEGGTYYASEKKLTQENTTHILKLLAADGIKFVETVVAVSQEGLAYKNDYALYALALAISFGDESTKKLVEIALPKVARTASHLTQFVAYATEFRGWGRAFKRTVASWYQNKSTKDLAYQCTKYANRNGWTQFDLLNAAHPVVEDAERNAIFAYIVKGKLPEGLAVPYIGAVEEAKTASVGRLIQLINEFKLPQELIPNEHRKNPDVWAALLNVGMPMTAMIRNLGAMTSYGTLKATNNQVDKVCERLADRDQLRSARVHPLQIIAALLTYKNGAGAKGNLTWNPVARILDALDESFYLTFETIEPSNKRISIGLDVSGSMTQGDCAGIPGLTPRVASAVLCMATIRTESKYSIGGFSSRWMDLADRVGKRMSLGEVLRNIDNLPFDRTDCSLPIEIARQRKEEFDAFVIYTDNETYAGNIHPFQSLKAYRKETGIDAKMIVVGMTSTGFTIADPSDTGMLDIVGLSTDTPAAISSFLSE